MIGTPSVPRHQPGVRHDRGVMLLALLIGLVLSGIALMGAVDVWTLQRQREREQQLLYAGDQYRQAIRRYYYAAPAGTPRTLPVSLELLLEDDRYPIPVRHLRRLYSDPITGQAEWGLLRAGDRIAGVYSLSEAMPVKQAGFSIADESFTGRSRYKEWVFSFTAAPGASSVALPVTSKKADEIPYFSNNPVKGSKK
jgi:type II secretory pathway pseudopilin PulG